MAYLILVRHGQTDWNVLGRFTGTTDIPLNAAGAAQAKAIALQLRDIELHRAHTSELDRAKTTLGHILDTLGMENLPTSAHSALNERSYGVYEGQTHTALAGRIGADNVALVRKAWDHPIPAGESLKQVHERVIPYFEVHILSDLKAGNNVIVSSHNNVMRALIKHLEHLSRPQVEQLELGNAEIRLYEIDDTGKLITKQIRRPDPTVDIAP